MKTLFGLWLLGVAVTIGTFLLSEVFRYDPAFMIAPLLVTAKLGWILICFIPYKFAKTKRHVDVRLIWWLSFFTIFIPPAFVFNMIWAINGPHEAPMTQTGFLAEERAS